MVRIISKRFDIFLTEICLEFKYQRKPHCFYFKQWGNVFAQVFFLLKYFSQFDNSHRCEHAENTAGTAGINNSHCSENFKLVRI